MMDEDTRAMIDDALERMAQAGAVRGPSVYLASPWVCRESTKAVRKDLQRAGYIVTSRWLDAPPGEAVPDKDRALSEARMDLEDIEACDMLVALTDERPVGAGHHVELGYALARGKLLIVIGPIKSVFHYLASHHFPDWRSARQFFLDLEPDSMTMRRRER